MSFKNTTRLALGNLRKNSRFYIPYILAGIGLEACFYIVLTLALDERLSKVRGGSYLPIFMGIGVIITAILSFILVLYANGFLMKQRKRELGLLNILGLEKKHVTGILFFETLYSALVSITVGLISGMVFYKLCTLLICRFLRVNSVLGFYFIRLRTIIPTLLFFLLLYLLTYFFNCISIRRMKPVELLRSAHTGEKEPKVNWFLFIPGVLSLGAGYYIAVTVKSPLKAINEFFLAVFLVIIGTYCLFTAGSIAVLRFLKSRKPYYYKKNHMITISGMLYRMRSNAVGLASITILSTAVLVMLSSTICLYGGIENQLKAQYPYEMYFGGVNYDSEKADEGPVMADTESMKKILEAAAKEQGLVISEAIGQKYLNVVYLLEDGIARCDVDADISKAADILFMTEEQYLLAGGSSLRLKENEIAIVSYNVRKSYEQDTLTVGGMTLKVVKILDTFPVSNPEAAMLQSAYGVVVSNQSVLDAIYKEQHDAYSVPSEYIDRLAVNFEGADLNLEKGKAFYDTLNEKIHDYVDSRLDASGSFGFSSDCKWDTADYIYGMYGTLLFLGLILGLVFLFTTTLIIYYKQISEGYEDRSRFQIMEKIGMTEDEVKGTVKSQILMVFFLPLITAGIHISFAFPIIEKILHLFMMTDTALFLIYTLVSFAGFALIYIFIYSMTARVYYKIVH